MNIEDIGDRAAEQPLTEAESIEEKLLEHGVPLDRIEDAVPAFVDLAERLGIVRTGEAFRFLLLCFPESRDITALARVVLGDGGESCASAAKRCKVSPMTLWRMEKAFKKRLRDMARPKGRGLD